LIDFTTKEEYIVGLEAIKEILWLRKILKDLK